MADAGNRVKRSPSLPDPGSGLGKGSPVHPCRELSGLSRRTMVSGHMVNAPHSLIRPRRAGVPPPNRSPVSQDVDHAAVRVADEEAADSPLLVP
ncbi:hypothetical protein GCM10018953_17430 [Streptosporangium nondiastaticum]